VRPAALLAASLLLMACNSRRPPPPAPQTVTERADEVAVQNGRALTTEFQCNRCHADVTLQPAEETKDCVGCHRNILDGKLKAAPSDLSRWQARVVGLGDAPSLAHARPRLRRSFVEGYLLKPHDLRPSLTPTMPRLELTGQQAKDIAAYLAPESELEPPVRDGDASRGRKLLDTKGCGTCHRFSGVAALAPSAIPVDQNARTRERAMMLAPDLRFTRDRLTRARLVDWMRDPEAVMPGTSMPTIPLTEQERLDIASYVMDAELAPEPARLAFVRLPVLARKVTYSEVDARIFHRTCWHCHSEPDFAIGDGGPGNSGGFGFKPRGLNLTSYASITAGSLDEKGERQSVLVGSSSRLVQALVARHAEEGGAATGTIRGMPLGLPPLSAEEIQLIESWVAQGRPR
jgi:cytochrome c2